MINKKRTDFIRNVLTLMTGTTIAQAIPIAISPILTRIYTPEDFGLLALFIAIASIFGSIANARYELAIMLPKKDEDAINIFALGLIITFVLSFILFILVIFFNQFFVNILQNEDIGFWLYFIPISVFFIGLFNSLSYFNNRKKYYKDIAKATVLKSVVLSIIQLSFSFIKSGVAGLISGEIISRMFANMKLLKNITKNKKLIESISFIRIIALAKKYKDFPKYSMWAVLANTLSSHVVTLFMSILYNMVTLGYYSLSEKVLGIPTALIGKSIGQVFFQEASVEKKSTGCIKNTFSKTIKKLVLLGVFIFGSLSFIIEDVFAFVFGEDWRIAGMYANILLILYFFRFIVSPLTLVPIVLEKVNIDLYFQLIMLTLISILLLISYFLKMTIIPFLFMFSCVYGLYYLIYVLYLNRMVKRDNVSK